MQQFQIRFKEDTGNTNGNFQKLGTQTTQQLQNRFTHTRISEDA